MQEKSHQVFLNDFWKAKAVWKEARTWLAG